MRQQPESPRIEELKAFKKELSDLIKYQRTSEDLCQGARGVATAWTRAAQGRDYQLGIVRKRAEKILGIKIPLSWDRSEVVKQGKGK